MERLKSNIKLNSEEHQQNATHMQNLVRDLKNKLDEIKLGGSKQAREKHTQKGKLLPRIRIEKLLDQGAPFLELSHFAGFELYEDVIPAAGLITGIGCIAGQECM